MQIQAEFASFLDVDNAAFESKVKAVSLKFFFILIFLSCVINSYIFIIIKYHLLSMFEARKTIFLHEVGTSTENVPSGHSYILINTLHWKIPFSLLKFIEPSYFSTARSTLLKPIP